MDTEFIERFGDFFKHCDSEYKAAMMTRFNEVTETLIPTKMLYCTKTGTKIRWDVNGVPYTTKREAVASLKQHAINIVIGEAIAGRIG